MTFCTVTVTYPQLVHGNNCDLPQFLLVTVKQVKNMKKVVKRRALMMKQIMCGVKLIQKT